MKLTKPFKLSASILRALLILERSDRDLQPNAFARQYYAQNDPGWGRHCKCGPNGTHRGSGLVMAAGAFLGRLDLWGLAKSGHITDLGQKTIAIATSTELRATVEGQLAGVVCVSCGDEMPKPERPRCQLCPVCEENYRSSGKAVKRKSLAVE